MSILVLVYNIDQHAGTLWNTHKYFVFCYWLSFYTNKDRRRISISSIFRTRQKTLQYNYFLTHKHELYKRARPTAGPPTNPSARPLVHVLPLPTHPHWYRNPALLVTYSTAIRSCKNHFFKLLLSLKTADYNAIIKLVQFLMNTTPNRGIHGYSPYLPHFSSHCSATVAKLNEIRYTLHQTRSMNLFLRQPNRQRICIGSKVRIKLKQNVFRKKNPIFNSLWSDSIYEISDYDCKRWPVTYQIKELPVIFPNAIPKLQYTKHYFGASLQEN